MVEEAFFFSADDTVLIKKAIAKSLYTKNIEQSKISEFLKLSQPMVSNYCNSNGQILIEDIGDFSVYGNSVCRYRRRTQIHSAQIPGAAYNISIILLYFKVKTGYI